MTAPSEMFAACAPGLEPLLAAELASLGALSPDAVPGGVRFWGHRRLLYRANLHSGLATRIRLRIDRRRVTQWHQLERFAAELPWERYLHAGVPRQVHGSARRSRLIHTEGIAERVARGLAHRLGDGLAERQPEGVRIDARIEGDVCQLSLDTSGEPLHRRGYRLAGGKAPLREDLARGLVLASGWRPGQVLIDPMCGAGTLVIEAALMASGRAPGLRRRFAFERTPLVHADTWSAVKDEALERVGRDAGGLYGFDRNPSAIRSAVDNAGRAQVSACVRFSAAALGAIDAPTLVEPAGAGAVVTHPPWGKRTAERRSLPNLYDALGVWISQLPPGFRVGLLVQDRRLGLRVGRLKTAWLSDAGGIKIRALVGAVGSR